MFIQFYSFLSTDNHGGGTTTNARNLELIYGEENCVFISGGDTMRKIAEERGYTMETFAEVLKTEGPAVDIEVNRRMMAEIMKYIGTDITVIIDSCIPDYLLDQLGIPLESRISIKIDCDQQIAAHRVFEAKTLKYGAVRINGDVCDTPEQLAVAYRKRTLDDQARYLDYFDFDMLGQDADITVDATNLKEIKVIAAVNSAINKLKKKKTAVVVGVALSGKTLTTKQAADHYGTGFVDTGMFYRYATYLRGDSEIDEKFLGILKVKLLAKDVQERMYEIFETLQSREISEVVNLTSSDPRVRNLVAIAQMRAVNLILEKNDLGFVVGRDTNEIFPGNPTFWFYNSDEEEVARRRLASEGNTSPSSEEIEAVVLKTRQRNTADMFRDHGGFQKLPWMIDFDTKGLTIPVQVGNFCQLVDENVLELA